MYDNGSVLILDPKTQNSFKVNGHRLKPYIGKEGPPLLIGKSFNPLRSQPLVNRWSELRLAKDVNLALVGRQPIFILFLHLFFTFSIYFYFLYLLFALIFVVVSL